jgi:multidrug efflux system membrane fusion protein
MISHVRFSFAPFAGASLVAALILGGCNRGASSPAPTKATAAPAVPVQVAVVQQLDMPRRIESIGAVATLRNVSVKSQVDGVIAEVHFREGDDVNAGDRLVSLDRRPFENSLRIARADLANAVAEAARAAADAERYQQLDQQAAVSKEQYAQLLTKRDTTRAQVQAKEAAVANAELLLSYTQIRAPMTGRTGQLLLHEGALVKANDNAFPIVTINQLAPIAVAYAVPEETLAEIRAALDAKRALVTVTDRTSGLKREDGKLEFVDNTVDATTGMITLKAIFPNADHALWPGKFMNVGMQVGQDLGALVVPSTAVQTSQSGSTIYVLKPDGTVDLRPVKIARVTGDVSLIASGVKAGETVVTDGQLRLTPGARAESKPLGLAPVAADGGPAANQKKN